MLVDNWQLYDNSGISDVLLDEGQKMKAPVSHLKNSTLSKAPQALLRAAEKARQLAEQTGTRFVVWQSQYFEVKEKDVNV
jgi:hypothetical protein